jgi:tetratricopeptide (TPR) repeat protein
MASHTVSYIPKTLLSVLFVFSLLLGPVAMLAQEATEEDFNAYTAIQNEKDVNKKADMVFSFLKDKPKSAYKEQVMHEYQTIIVELNKQKNWNQIIALGDKFLDVAPNDTFTSGALAKAYAETNNTKGFATFGEKAFAQKPSAELALEISRAYQKLGNDAKYMQWREKVLSLDPENVEILIDMTRKYMASQNTAQAVKYAHMTLKALPTAKKPEGVDAAAWKNQTDAGYATAYAVIGANAYQNKNYTEAIANFDNSVKYFKRNDSAYYHLGLCYWQQNKLQPAMLNFAKAYILKGATAAGAKKYLDQIWASSHRNSLAGEQAVIDRAQQDLK